MSGRLLQARLALFRLFGVSDDLTRLVSHELSLTDFAEGSTPAQAVDEILSVVQTVNLIWDREVADSLALVDAAPAVRLHFETVPDTLTVVDFGEGSRDLEFELDHFLGLSDEAQPNIKNATAVDELELADALDSNFIYVEVHDDLTLVQDEDHAGPVLVSVHQPLNLSDESVGTIPIVTVVVEQELELVQGAGRVRTVIVAQPMSLVSSGDRFIGGSDQLGLVQTAIAGKGADIADELGLTDALTYTALFGRSLSDSLNLVSAATAFVVRATTECNYTPFVGSSNGDIAPPPMTPPTLGTATLTLTYPLVSPTETLILRNPEFGNRDRLVFMRINRDTRDGTLIVFARPTWPKTQSLQVSIEFLKQEQVDRLLDFLGRSLGQEIGLLDHEDRQWRGIITTPDAEVSQPRRGGYNVSFDFEGELA